MIDLITDRTQSDVSYAESNRDSKIPNRGAYNSDDYNRVGLALNYLSDWLFELGYGFNPKLRTNWKTNENFTPDDGAYYLSTIEILKQSFFTLSTTPTLPRHIHDLFSSMGFVWANNIEQILFDINILIHNMIISFIYSGEIYSGENY